MTTFHKDYVLAFATSLLGIDSPTGYTKHAIAFIETEAKALGYHTSYNEKGNLFIHVDGKEHEHVIGLSAHTDTLGLMVRSIKSNATLAVTTLGGPLVPTLDGEYCRIITRDGTTYTGTILCTSPASHVYKDASSLPREIDNMEIRIDEMVKTKEDVEALGIQNGDIVAIDPKIEITKNDFIKSRFLDDKISAAALMGLLKYIKDNHIIPDHDLMIIMSTYEEVGHGASCLPSKVKELLAVDMGCIGLDLACSEYDVSICAKDSSGPYDYEMTSTLIRLAKQEKLSYAVDIYPMYGSDVSAALRGGNDLKGALIGPGVHASHGMERTHYQGVLQTMKLLLAYISKEA